MSSRLLCVYTAGRVEAEQWSQVMGDERRIATRFRRQLKVSIGDLQLETSNVSESGLQLVCPPLWLRRLKRSIQNARLELGIRIGEDLQVTATGRVAYISEAGDEFLVGVAFEHFAGDGERTWKACCQ
jgi:hypothetical protein